MELYKIRYFKKNGNGICGGDFDNGISYDKINLKFLLSISELQKFNMPLSGNYVGKYALVTMSNNDKYYIKEDSFKDLSAILDM